MDHRKQAYRVRVIGGFQADEMLLLRTQIGRLSGMWSLVESDEANVILYNLDTADGRTAWDGHNRDDANNAHVAVGEGPPPEARYAIGRPLRASELVQILQRVQGEVRGEDRPAPRKLGISSPSARARAAAKAQVTRRGEHDPEQLLLGLLRSLSGRDPVAIGSSGHPEILILVRPHAGEAWTRDWPRLIPLTRMTTAEIRCEKISLPDAQSLAAQGYTKRGLDELIWFAALEGSQGRPLRQLRTNQPIRLKTLPDFQRLYRRPADVLIAYVMSRSSMPLDEVAKTARASESDVIGLCNACACLGLLQVQSASAAATPTRKVPKKRSALFQRIFDRLSRSGGGAS